MKRVLVAIGGLDPTGHAGLMADARVLEHYRLPYRCITTAVTAQNDRKFFAFETCPVKFFRRQLESIDQPVAGVKIGMLGTTRLISAILDWLKQTRPPFVIWDPIIQSSSGGKLFREASWNPNLQKLLKQVTLWTPNGPEAEWILGRRIRNFDDMAEAISTLFQLGRRKPRAVLLKGGHIRPKSDQVLDLFYDGKILQALPGKRIATARRGTGCTLAAAILCHLALKKNPLAATRAAKRYLIKNWVT